MRPALTSAQTLPALSHQLECSMCGAPAHQLRYLMSGVAGGHLCDRCTWAAVRIVIRTWLSELFGGRRR